MGLQGRRGILGAAMLTGITIAWMPFSSKLYPYTISQPSSFRHEVVTAADGQKVDYFFPSLTGSFPTNVHIYAMRGRPMENAVRYLRNRDGRHVHRVGWLTFMGHRHPLLRAEFTGLAGHWVEEDASFSANGYSWRLTASYEPRFRSLRPVMVRMLNTFQTH